MRLTGFETGGLVYLVFVILGVHMGVLIQIVLALSRIMMQEFHHCTSLPFILSIAIHVVRSDTDSFYAKYYENVLGKGSGELWSVVDQYAVGSPSGKTHA